MKHNIALNERFWAKFNSTYIISLYTYNFNKVYLKKKINDF